MVKIREVHAAMQPPPGRARDRTDRPFCLFLFLLSLASRGTRAASFENDTPGRHTPARPLQALFTQQSPRPLDSCFIRMIERPNDEYPTTSLMTTFQHEARQSILMMGFYSSWKRLADQATADFGGQHAGLDPFSASSNTYRSISPSSLVAEIPQICDRRGRGRHWLSTRQVICDSGAWPWQDRRSCRVAGGT
jgi:hypothetical protein